MARFIWSLTCLLTFVFFLFTKSYSQTIRIMPMGNSITYDENSFDTPGNERPIGNRISYRYKLYQLITAAGYSFDYVGSENAGNNYFQNEQMDDCAAFPGITDAQLAHLIISGYNQRTQQYESPAAYFLYYPADIILLHIGTNAVDPNPADVENILNYIRAYDNDVTVLVARIINRATYDPVTTAFNNNVESMVIARDDPRIKMVNMETGAGINYSTDMIDNLHPNTVGYNKMAAKWFEAIKSLNTSPVVSVIPQQSVNQGTAFSDLHLDNYVTDNEDADNLIKWNYKQQTGSKFAISIDANRMAHINVTSPEWYGQETIWFIATDSGNGGFPESDSVGVIFKVAKKNELPVITSTPVTNTLEDNNYSYTINASDSDGNNLQYSAVEIPAWLTFNTTTHTVYGKPSNSEVGTYNILLRVFDGSENVDQAYQLTVINTNDLPVIATNPVKTAKVNESYLYEFKATDIDVDDTLIYSAVIKPAWLTFNTSLEAAFLTGKPSSDNVGPNSVILKVSDGHNDIIHGFTIEVSPLSSTDNNTEAQKVCLYPNPFNDKVHLRTEMHMPIKFWLYDSSGYLLLESAWDNTTEITIDLGLYTSGIYLYKAVVDNQVFTGKLIKSL